MKSVLRFVVVCVLALVSLGVFAQDGQTKDTVNLAMIASINVTLDADCNAVIVPSEVLTGDFDVDGDGNVPPDEAFLIEVLDGTPGNNEIIDGCGTYTVRVTADTSLVAGFTTGWASVNAEDKTAPVFVSTPTAPAGPLYCDAIDRISLAELPSTISRCYVLNNATGVVDGSTLAPELAALLTAGGGFPLATDNCSEFVEICVNDILTRDPVSPDCNDVLLTRTFTATDGSCPSVGDEPNAAATTSYEIVFTRPTLDDLDDSNIPAVVTVECTELEAMGLTFGDLPQPRPEDLPFFPGPDGTTIPLTLGGGNAFCGIGVVFTDSAPITTCENAYKVVRTYTLLDWCNPDDVRTLQQVVKIGDFTAPELTVVDGEQTFSTNGGALCGAVINLEAPIVGITDACSDVLTVSAYIYPNRDLTGNPLGAYPINLNDNLLTTSDLLPEGNHLIRYFYADECLNRDTTDVDIVVVDRTPPVAVCEDGLNVSISSNVSPDGVPGLAVLTPSMIDDGSYDDCSGFTLDIARLVEVGVGEYDLAPGAAYDQTVRLTCEDLGIVPVGLRVRDDNGVDNFCWMNVLLEDKTDPTCTPPADLTLSCEAYNAAGLPNDITQATDVQLDGIFGVAIATDNCSVDLQQAIGGSVNSCGIGTFTRTFTTTNGESFQNNQLCVQTIEVVGLHDYQIVLPGDALTFCTLSPVAGELGINPGNCDLITTQVSRDTFVGDADECYKIRLEYLIINWCEYNSLGEPYEIPRDYDGDNNLREEVYLHVLPGADDLSRTDDVALLDNDANPNNNTFTLELDNGNGPYGTNDSRGAFTYVQFLKVQDEVAPELVLDDRENCFPAFGINCTGTVELSFELSDNCTDPSQLEFRVELDEDYDEITGFSRTRFLLDSEVEPDGQGNFMVTIENVLTGEHALRIRGGDGCGNVDVRILEFCVEDNRAPTPICINQTTVTLMPNGNGTGEAAYWATDALASPTEDCSGEVTYSVYKRFETLVDGFEPAPNRDGIIFDCDDDQTVPIRVYAFDPAGRADFCEVLVLVQGAANACVATGNLASLGGDITTYAGDPLRDVSVNLTGLDEDVEALTDNDGAYEFSDLLLGEDYTVTPTYESYVQHSQGVSTFDLVLITRYILGLDDMESPYQRLAADTNGDEEISVQDIIAARRLILGLDNAYQESPGWRFVDENFVFPVSANPWATSFPEVINFNNLAINIRNANFIAVMVGDVSGNRNGFAANGGGVPRNDVRSLELTDRELAAGETTTVTITAAEATGLTGVQGTFRFDGLTVLEVTGGQLADGNLNLDYLERGLLPFSLATAAGISAETPVLTLTVRAETDLQLREAITVTDDVLRAEGYVGTSALAGVALSAVGGEAANPLTAAELGQNVPNPATGFTQIPFTVTEAGPVQLVIRDLTGRIVLRREATVAAGRNSLEVNLDRTGVSGVLTYTLTAGDFSATRKMIVR